MADLLSCLQEASITANRDPTLSSFASTSFCKRCSLPAFDHTFTEQRDQVKLTSRAPPPFFFFSAVLATWHTYSGGVAPSAFDDSPKSGVMGRDVTSSAFFCIGIYACDLLIVWLGVELLRAGGHLVRDFRCSHNA